MCGSSPESQDRIRKLRWRSRRGLLELDLLLAPFVHPESGRLATLSDRLLEQFETLLECEDVDVHEWLLGRSKAPVEVTEVVAEIRRAGES